MNIQAQSRYISTEVAIEVQPFHVTDLFGDTYQVIGIRVTLDHIGYTVKTIGYKVNKNGTLGKYSTTLSNLKPEDHKAIFMFGMEYFKEEVGK